MQEVGVLVKHEFVAAIQNGQKPPSRFPPVPHTPPLQHNPSCFVSALGLELPGGRRLRDPNAVTPVLKSTELHHKEEVVGGVTLRRLLDLKKTNKKNGRRERVRD